MPQTPKKTVKQNLLQGRKNKNMLNHVYKNQYEETSELT